MLHMSHVMRKQDFCLGQNIGADQLCSNCTADKCLCRDFPTFSKQGPGTNDFGKNNMYISQIGKMDTKQNRGYYAYLVLI